LNAGANIKLILVFANIFLKIKKYFFLVFPFFIFKFPNLKKYKMSSKIKYELEFPIQSSPQLLYQYISTPSGLSEWFADNVNSRGEFFTFIWDDSEEKAKLTSKKSGERIKFRWLNEDDSETEYFFELKIMEDEITKDVSIVISDYAFEDELAESKLLWENQISDLKHVLGSV
jgi:uncharacterized protein YndB with AHSA1/START domain